MSRSTKAWLAGIAATLIAATAYGIGSTLASDHDKVTRIEEALPRIESKIDNLATKVDNLTHR